MCYNEGQRMKLDLNQEVVALEINNVLEFI
jgi:hypothetical protein